MWFFRRKQAQRRQDGLTAETAFKMPAIGSASAISIEYKTLGKLFGREGDDWRIHDRIRSQTNTGQQLEKFIVGTRDGRKVIYFDITDVLKSADPEPVQEIVDAVMHRQRNRRITITLPRGAFFILYKIMDDVADQLAGKEFDTEEVVSALLATMQENDIETSEQFDVTLSVADWLHIGSMTGLVKVPTVPGQEFLSDLRDYVHRALKQAGSG
jgi:hypothetical protein